MGELNLLILGYKVSMNPIIVKVFIVSYTKNLDCIDLFENMNYKRFIHGRKSNTNSVRR
jgi:hypothetical protein